MFCKTSARYDVRYIFRVYIIVNPRCVSDFADGGEDERAGSRPDDRSEAVAHEERGGSDVHMCIVSLNIGVVAKALSFKLLCFSFNLLTDNDNANAHMLAAHTVHASPRAANLAAPCRALQLCTRESKRCALGATRLRVPRLRA